MIEKKIAELLEEKFKEEDFIDCFLVETRAGKNQHIEVFVDSDGELTLAKCQKISRYLESHIDEKGWLGAKYRLEVSSPGIGRPLKFYRQYPKNIGRKVEVTTEEGVKKGKLVAVTEEQITLEDIVTRKQGKKKIKETVQTEIPFVQIKKTIIKISFKTS